MASGTALQVENQRPEIFLAATGHIQPFPRRCTLQLGVLTGGIFILYLAYGAFKAWRTYNTKKTVPVQSIRQNVLKAAIVNWLNPNPYLGWSLVIGPLPLKGWRETPVNGVILLVSFYGIMFASMTAIIMLFHAARNLGPKVNRAMIGLSAAALACFGLYQWWSGIKALW